MKEPLFRLTAFGSINMNLESKNKETQNGNMHLRDGVQMDLPNLLEKYMMQDATYIPYTKERKQDLIPKYDRVCAWCPEPNEMVGNDAQLVFPFYYDFGHNISHGMCNVCTENFIYISTQEYR